MHLKNYKINNNQLKMKKMTQKVLTITKIVLSLQRN